MEARIQSSRNALTSMIRLGVSALAILVVLGVGWSYATLRRAPHDDLRVETRAAAKSLIGRSSAPTFAQVDPRWTDLSDSQRSTLLPLMAIWTQLNADCLGTTRFGRQAEIAPALSAWLPMARPPAAGDPARQSESSGTTAA